MTIILVVFDMKVPLIGSKCCNKCNIFHDEFDA